MGGGIAWATLTGDRAAAPATRLAWHLCRVRLCRPQGAETGRAATARGSTAKYTHKQKRKAEHIAEGYADRGAPEAEAKRRAWATVNKEPGGGKKESHASWRKGGAVSARRPAAARSASAKKAPPLWKRNAARSG